jgi:hypothetical protein
MVFHTLDAAAIEKLLSRAESREERALPLDPPPPTAMGSLKTPSLTATGGQLWL